MNFKCNNGHFFTIQECNLCIEGLCFCPHCGSSEIEEDRERSKREDCGICEKCQEAFFNGGSQWCDLCYKNNLVLNYKFNRCGALNSMET